MSEVYHVFSVLDFEDDTIDAQKLSSGTLEECNRTAELINAVMYNGHKTVRQSLIRIISDTDLNHYLESV
jgi:hypothetical protein